MKKKLDQFSGPLNPAEIAAGMNHANKNGKRLLADAKILFKAGRYPSAAALAILSIEEFGKSGILRDLAVAKNQDEVRQAWREYRSHTRKNVMWILPYLAAAGAKRLHDFEVMWCDNASEHPKLLDMIKQISIYTDCIGEKHWSFPETIIDADPAQGIINIAEILSNEGEITEREIELWIKHMKPVWNKQWMDKAISNWYAEMQSEGLKPEGENVMEQFIRHGITSENGDKESHEK